MTPLMSVAALADGETAPCRVGGVEVLVCRVDGAFFAVSNRCPHAGQALHTGRLDGHRLRCPLHNASFDVRDGRCLGGPAESDLTRYPVMIERGRVCVSASAPRPAGH